MIAALRHRGIASLARGAVAVEPLSRRGRAASSADRERAAAIGLSLLLEIFESELFFSLFNLDSDSLSPSKRSLFFFFFFFFFIIFFFFFTYAHYREKKRITTQTACPLPYP